MLTYNGSLKQFSRNLRSGMTDAERRLWSRIRRRQLKEYQFFRQRIIGSYIVDFYCPNARLVIELDGGQHYNDEGIEKDRKRDEVLMRLGLNVMRFSDRDVFENIEGVLERIFEALPEKIPLNPPFAKGGGTENPPQSPFCERGR